MSGGVLSRLRRHIDTSYPELVLGREMYVSALGDVAAYTSCIPSAHFILIDTTGTRGLIYTIHHARVYIRSVKAYSMSKEKKQ